MTERYDLAEIWERAKQRCRDKNESWRWGEAERDPKTGKDKVL